MVFGGMRSIWGSLGGLWGPEWVFGGRPKGSFGVCEGM